MDGLGAAAGLKIPVPDWGTKVLQAVKVWLKDKQKVQIELILCSFSFHHVLLLVQKASSWWNQSWLSLPVHLD